MSTEFIVKGRTGWTSIPHWIWTSGLSSGAVHLLGYMMGHKDSFREKLTISTVGRNMGVSWAAVKRAADELAEVGLIHLSLNKATGGRPGYTFEIDLAKISRIDPSRGFHVKPEDLADVAESLADSANNLADSANREEQLEQQEEQQPSGAISASGNGTDEGTNVVDLFGTAAPKGKKAKKKLDLRASEFEVWWKAYPRRDRGKAHALGKWNAHVRAGDLPSIDLVLAATEDRARRVVDDRDDVTRMEHAGTWLHDWIKRGAPAPERSVGPRGSWDGLVTPKEKASELVEAWWLWHVANRRVDPTTKPKSGVVTMVVIAVQAGFTRAQIQGALAAFSRGDPEMFLTAAGIENWIRRARRDAGPLEPARQYVTVDECPEAFDAYREPRTS